MAVQTKEGVLTLLQDQQERIRQFGVRRLGLFGSFIRQQQDAESDVDMLVEFKPERKTFDAFMQMAAFLEDLLERRVELVTPESLTRIIQCAVQRHDSSVGEIPTRQLSLHRSFYSEGGRICRLRSGPTCITF